MKAGELTTRVTVQVRTGGVDDWGSPLPEAWADFATLWANVRHLSGAETIRADAETSTVKASIRVRWRGDLNAGMRVLVGGKAYTVEAVMPNLQSREHIDLVCKLVE